MLGEKGGDRVRAGDEVYRVVNGLCLLVSGSGGVELCLTGVALELCLGKLILGVGKPLLGGVILGKL